MPIKDVCPPFVKWPKPQPLPHAPAKSRGVEHSAIYSAKGQGDSGVASIPRPPAGEPDPFPAKR
jgi:hypothetical protein